MTIMGCCVPSRDTSDRFSDRCFAIFPCLSDPVRRSTLCLRLALVMLHIVFVGFLVIFDDELISKSKQQPWHSLIYMLLVVATLVQYFYTSGSSPGYVLDAMREFAKTEASLRASVVSKQPASSKNGSVVVTLDKNQLGENLLGNNPMNWTKLVMEMYPPGTSVRTYTCSYCNVVQPPRTKHCHDCDRCVLQFDHHCVWLGTCIGQGNHCRFWWYILEETALSIWTGILYINYLQTSFGKAWLVDAIMIILLSILAIGLIFLLLLLLFHSYLILTNQTTYELVRRRRIPYLRAIPERVYPFSKGACRNLYNFCFARTSIYAMEPLPSAAELEQMSVPYTCFDVISCRCCC
uniref:protein S-acyltransferase 10 n=1 Tax=Erigeron canadensis TaxID=72917 RepID=UPI001CB94254|nr:protein S-acyltransferase 10 [Erigeron canadensis]